MVLLGALGAALILAAEPVRLAEEFPPGYRYHVSSRVELSGQLTLPPPMAQKARTLPFTGNSAVEYDERVLAGGAGDVQKTLRVYRRLDMKRKLGEETQEPALRPSVRRLVLLRHKEGNVAFSPDGPLTWAEIELLRGETFTPALTGLLPAQAVRPGDRWSANFQAVQELTGLEKAEEGSLECRLEQITSLAGRRHARVALSGTVRGVNQDGPIRRQLDGYFYFDLESNHLSYLTFRGVTSLLDKDGKESGRTEGRFVLTRQAHVRPSDLDDQVLGGMALEPSADSTQLLYDNPFLGLRLLYPRRWRLSGENGRQVTLDEASGAGLLLTLDPLSRLPTAAQFQAESQNYFVQKQKAKVLRADPPRRLQNGPREVDVFSLEVEIGGQKVSMDYYVLRQATGGATAAVRLSAKDPAATRREAERIVRDLAITAAQK